MRAKIIRSDLVKYLESTTCQLRTRAHSAPLPFEEVIAVCSKMKPPENKPDGNGELEVKLHP
jgi:hypothetical protein